MSGAAWPYLAREFDVMVPGKHKIQGSVNSKLLENCQGSGPYSSLKHYLDNAEQGRAFISRGVMTFPPAGIPGEAGVLQEQDWLSQVLWAVIPVMAS